MTSEPVVRWAVVDEEMSRPSQGEWFRSREDAEKLLKGLRSMSMRGFAKHKIVSFELREIPTGEIPTGEERE